MGEKKAHDDYNKILLKIKNQLGNQTTYGYTLQRKAIQILGTKFHGVYPSDKIPNLNALKPYAILNLDNSNQAGSHWIAVALDGKNLIVYDSFGRNHTKIIPNLKKEFRGRIHNTDRDPEQKKNEFNCGQRSISFLLFFEKYGAKRAMLI